MVNSYCERRVNYVSLKCVQTLPGSDKIAPFKTHNSDLRGAHRQTSLARPPPPCFLRFLTRSCYKVVSIYRKEHRKNQCTLFALYTDACRRAFCTCIHPGLLHLVTANHYSLIETYCTLGHHYTPVAIDKTTIHLQRR